MFIVVISTALALRFKQVTERVLNYGKHIQSLEFWSEIRSDYIHLFELCQLINKYVSFQITLSFAFNTCYFLLDLFFVIRWISINTYYITLLTFLNAFADTAIHNKERMLFLSLLIAFGVFSQLLALLFTLRG